MSDCCDCTSIWAWKYEFAKVRAKAFDSTIGLWGINAAQASSYYQRIYGNNFVNFQFIGHQPPSTIVPFNEFFINYDSNPPYPEYNTSDTNCRCTKYTNKRLVDSNDSPGGSWQDMYMIGGSLPKIRKKGFYKARLTYFKPNGSRGSSLIKENIDWFILWEVERQSFFRTEDYESDHKCCPGDCYGNDFHCYSAVTSIGSSKPQWYSNMENDNNTQMWNQARAWLPNRWVNQIEY